MSRAHVREDIIEAADDVQRHCRILKHHLDGYGRKLDEAVFYRRAHPGTDIDTRIQTLTDITYALAISHERLRDAKHALEKAETALAKEAGK